MFLLRYSDHHDSIITQIGLNLFLDSSMRKCVTFTEVSSNHQFTFLTPLLMSSFHLNLVI